VFKILYSIENGSYYCQLCQGRSKGTACCRAYCIQEQRVQPRKCDQLGHNSKQGDLHQTPLSDNCSNTRGGQVLPQWQRPLGYLGSGYATETWSPQLGLLVCWFPLHGPGSFSLERGLMVFQSSLAVATSPIATVTWTCQRNWMTVSLFSETKTV